MNEIETKEEIIKKFQKEQKEAYDFYKEAIAREGLKLTQIRERIPIY